MTEDQKIAAWRKSAALISKQHDQLRDEDGWSDEALMDLARREVASVERWNPGFARFCDDNDLLF